MDFNNLTKQDKANIICVVNEHYEYSILHSVHSVVKDVINLELAIYRDDTKQNPVYIGIGDFNRIYRDY